MIILLNLTGTTASFEHSKNAFEHATIVDPRTNATSTLWQKRLEVGPLLSDKNAFSIPSFSQDRCKSEITKY
jgi:hypothetical protein